MASDLNVVMMIGRLTRDPQVRVTQSGANVCSFSLANNKTYSTNGEKKESVSFFNCVAWGTLSDLIEKYCTKGMRVGVTGKLAQRSYDATDGSKKSVVEITVSEIQFLSQNTENTEKNTNQPLPSRNTETPNNNNANSNIEEDFPF
jgi:single-strand DNA-binding protein